MLYYPILRIKKGEADALANLKVNTRNNVRPVLVIPPMDTVILSKEEKSKGVSLAAKQQRKDDNYIPSFAKNLGTALNGTGTLTYYLDAKPAALSPTRLQQLLTKIKPLPVKPRPVLYLQGSAVYWQLYNSVLSAPEAVMLRLTADELSSPGTPSLVAQWHKLLNLGDIEVVIMLDAGDVSGAVVSMYAPTISNMHNQLQKVLPRARYVVAGGGYPSNLVRVTPWVEHRFERKCWTLWLHVHQWQPDIHFADYGPMSAVTLNEAAQRGAPKVRYTLSSDFMLYQGVVKTVAKMTKPAAATSIKPAPSPTDQYLIISNHVHGHSNYPGASFSWGDKHVYLAKDPLFLKRGNPTTWVTVNVSHHVEHVVAALASPATPLGSVTPASQP